MGRERGCPNEGRCSVRARSSPGEAVKFLLANPCRSSSDTPATGSQSKADCRPLSESLRLASRSAYWQRHTTHPLCGFRRTSYRPGLDIHSLQPTPPQPYPWRHSRTAPLKLAFKPISFSNSSPFTATHRMHLRCKQSSRNALQSRLVRMFTCCLQGGCENIVSV